MLTFGLNTIPINNTLTKENPMADTTDIEKKSLEAHVELCAERYKLLELKLESLQDSGASLKEMIADVHAMMQTMSTKRNDQLINWGLGIITFLVGVIGYLINTHVLT